MKSDKESTKAKNVKICDLHTHSYYSDGTLSPTELVELAKAKGISAIMLTDHNTTSGITEFLSAAKKEGIEATAGIELSTEYKGLELHLIGAFIPEDKLPVIDEMLDDLRKRKEIANRELIDKLSKAGYDITFDEVKKMTTGTMNRTHIAAVLIKKGYTESIKEAITTVLSEGAGFYTPPKRLPTLEAIRLVKELGGITVLAHPLFTLTEAELRAFLSEAVPAGLDAMECVYSTYDEKTTHLAKKIAREFSLLESGGSDYHGERRPDIELGAGHGNLKVPYEFYEKLSKRRRK